MNFSKTFTTLVAVYGRQVSILVLLDEFLEGRPISALFGLISSKMLRFFA